MDIIIYNPNSRGGNFDYALRLSEELRKNSLVRSVKLVVPGNANVTASQTILKLLLGDAPPSKIKVLSRIYFLWRSVVNPILFYNFIRSRRGHIIFNDFDQTTSFFWSVVYKHLRARFFFSIILHDPDRDNYFSSQALSGLTMRNVMSIMDVAFYHEILPDKSYYRNKRTSYFSIPHGLYPIEETTKPDVDLSKKLRGFKGADKLITTLGNIRNEKNYDIIIKALTDVKGLKFLISGVPANSSVNLAAYLALVKRNGLEDRVLILEKYFDNAELKSITDESDAFVLYYADSFKSQSGILNLLAPLKKTLLVSKTDSALSLIVKKYKLGLMAVPDSVAALGTMLKAFMQNEFEQPEWDSYFEYSSWKNNSATVIDVLSKLRR